MTDKIILVTSGYGGNTQRPFVMIEAEELDRPIQLSPDEARNLGINLMQAAEAAESDQSIVEFGMKKLNLSLQEAAGLLVQFREVRKRKKP